MMFVLMTLLFQCIGQTIFHAQITSSLRFVGHNVHTKITLLFLFSDIIFMA